MDGLFGGMRKNVAYQRESGVEVQDCMIASCPGLDIAPFSKLLLGYHMKAHRTFGRKQLLLTIEEALECRRAFCKSQYGHRLENQGRTPPR